MEPRDLLIHQLAQMLAIEETLADDVLPELSKRATERQFELALDEHLDQTRMHVERLQSVFDEIGVEKQREGSLAFDGLRSQYEELVGKVDDPTLRDLFSASAAAHTEHFEISSYHSLITLANLLGEPEVVRLLEESLHEEEEALEKVEKSIPERLVGKLAPA